MASNQPVNDGALYLHRCLANSNCTINWDTVGAALDLKPGTASKRYSRLRQRIDKNNDIHSGKWSGDLDQDGEFLLECITSSKCQIDFNAVGRDCNLKPATASKRYSRLIAKYKLSAGTSSDEAAAASAITQTSISNTIKTPKKRKGPVEEEPDLEEETPTKKRKIKLEAKRPAQAAQVKEEVQDRVNIPATDGASDFRIEKRETRGKKIKYFSDDFSDLEETEEDSQSDPEAYSQPDSQDETDEYMSDSDGEIEPVTPRRVPASSRTVDMASAGRMSISKRHVPSYIPIGLSGLQVLHGASPPRQYADSSNILPSEADDSSTGPVSASEDSTYESASEKTAVEPDSPTAHGAQLETELQMAGDLDATSEDKKLEEVLFMPSIEGSPRLGFLARMLPWWK